MSQEEANRIARAVQRMRRSRGGLKLALPTVAALGAGTAIAIGAIPGGDGTITGCYVTNPDAVPGATSPRYGALRVIDPSQTSPLGGPTETNSCLADEATITWSQRGPQGPQGPQGPTGAQGPAGTPLIGETSFGVSGGGRTFLKLDGIKGESIDKTHKGEIDIESFSLSTGGSHGATGGGGGAGKVSIQSFTITKHVDKASPLLFKAASTGQHFKQVVLAFARKAGGKEHDYLQFKFSNVLVSAIQDGNSQKQIPQEQVTFAYEKVNETFIGTSAGGKTQKVSVNLTIHKGA
jgi:type VI secretion system secreted protein Hcp